MRRSRALTGVVAALSLLFVLPGATSADSPAVTNGNGNAQGTWRDSPNNWTLCDLASNGRSVYIHAGETKSLAESGQRRYENFNGGCVATGVYTLPGSTVWWRVCENIPGGPDSCSTTREDFK